MSAQKVGEELLVSFGPTNRKKTVDMFANNHPEEDDEEEEKFEKAQVRQRLESMKKKSDIDDDEEVKQEVSQVDAGSLEPQIPESSNDTTSTLNFLSTTEDQMIILATSEQMLTDQSQTTTVEIQQTEDSMVTANEEEVSAEFMREDTV